ncbi:DUF4097 family beta strand repeat-containing protein [Nocardiopsis sp. FIRDI 009]|uniref:DUF4097 family beta strand repeat-containing protein n=1 Tax=Nocardiopsis sp. FIRDI 009 TaxID=714197 RepID=UPI000E281391|nr:DUF4097 family beta strand repeat-containing protein [Nocardiopsis sp. FIRDI 009]
MTSIERTLTSQITGPITLRISAPVLHTTVTVDPTAHAASVRLSGPADVVEAATNEQTGREWTVSLPPERTNTTSMTFGFSGRGTVIQAGSINGSVVMSARSHLASRIDAGLVRVRGFLAGWKHHGTAADLEAETVGSLRAVTVSGDVEIQKVTGAAQVQTTSGDVDLDLTGPTTTVQSVSGDITLTAAGQVTVSTTSGDVRAELATDESVSLATVSGGIRTHTRPGHQPRLTTTSVSGRIR